MLRNEVGDVDFWNGIRTYYATYQNSNAMTSDFKRVIEEASGKDLSLFFHQWLYTGGHPNLTGSWSYNAKLKEVTIDVKQTQKGAFFQSLFVPNRLLDSKTTEWKNKVIENDGNYEKFNYCTVSRIN